MCALSSGPGEPTPTSVGFTVAVHVVAVRPGVLSAVETVQEASRDLRHQRSVWDGLGHAVDRSLKQQEDTTGLQTHSQKRL